MLPYNDIPYIMTSWDYKIRFNNDDETSLWEHNVRELVENGIKV